MAEYETNTIAPSNKDKKRIHKTEARANRKAKADKAKKLKSRQWPYRKPSGATCMNGFRSGSNNDSGAPIRQGLCFVCGNLGYWESECPQWRKQIV